MADYRVVDIVQLEGDLSAVADAIRARTGDSGVLVFPEGYTEAIAAIPEAGSSSEEQALLDGSFTGNYYNDRITRVKAYGLAYISGITDMHLPNVVQIGGYMSTYATNLKSARLPKLEGAGGTTAAFAGCTALEFADMGMTGGIAISTFAGCGNIKKIVLRSNKVAELQNINAFNGTPYASGGAGGKVYVPSALIESYKTATNWSVLYGYGTCEFGALEGSEYE